MTRVLFVCVKNGGKSQMAAGLFRQVVAADPEPDRWVIGSAGTRAGSQLNALSVESMAEVGIDISDQQPRQLTPELQQAVDVVVTVGEADVEPLPGPVYVTWEIDEPSLRGIDGPERMRLVRDDISRQVHDLHQALVPRQAALMASPAPYDTTVERELGAGCALFELCQDEDVALADSWDGNDEQLKVEPGRLGVESAAQDHRPEIALASYATAPGPVTTGYDLVGQVEVQWATDHVELWTSASDVGEARQLSLPPSLTGNYHLRAARAFAPQVSGTLKDYLWEHDNVDTHGLERWRFDFWPA